MNTPRSRFNPDVLMALIIGLLVGGLATYAISLSRTSRPLTPEEQSHLAAERLDAAIIKIRAEKERAKN